MFWVKLSVNGFTLNKQKSRSNVGFFLLGPPTDANVSASGGESGGRSRFNDDVVVSLRDLLAERGGSTFHREERRCLQRIGRTGSLIPRDNVITKSRDHANL